MSELGKEKPRFTFRSTGLAEDAFSVVRFRGSEDLSVCYRFETELASADPAMDAGNLLAHPAAFTILREEGDLCFHGILSEFEQRHQSGGNTFYRAVLVPRLWWLSVTRHNQVFLAKTVPDVLEACLRDGGLSPDDFELRLQKEYPVWEYLCQYDESHLDFIRRWMEREGMYFFFEQGESGEKVVIADTRIVHTAMAEGRNIRYAPPSGMDHAHREEVIHEFSQRLQRMPAALRLRDRNYRTPSLEIAAEAAVNPRGRGEVYVYGEHFRSPEEADRLAVIWAEEARCREKRFHGSGTVPFLRPGYRFSLEGHYREDVNGEYLTLAVEHEGSQAAYLLSGLGLTLSEGERQPFYRNRFTAIPGSVQYRPERKTTRPRCHGVLSARVDGSGSGQYAELDDQGRYKVVLPFDLSGRGPGKASAWIRMAQPYAGESCGMHFPLHKGTEVLLSFMEGDPDRPVIAAAVPNPAAPSPVTAENQSQSVVQTASGNRVAFEDRQGSERVLLSNPATRTFLRIGQPNDPPTPVDKEGKHGIALSTSGEMFILVGFQNSVILGESTSIVLGNDNKLVVGIRSDTTRGRRINLFLALLQEITAGYHWSFGTSWDTVRGFSHRAAPQSDVVILSHDELIAAKENTIAQLRAAITQQEEIIAAQGRIIGIQQEAITAKEETLASKQRIVGAKSDIIALKSTAIGAQDEILAAKDKILAAKEETHGVRRRTSATVDRISGEVATLSGQIQEMGVYNQL